jgi:hypothetical protein
MPLCSRSSHFSQVHLWEVALQMHAEDALDGWSIREGDLNHFLEPAGSRQRGVQRARVVAGGNHDDTLSTEGAIQLL